MLNTVMMLELGHLHGVGINIKTDCDGILYILLYLEREVEVSNTSDLRLTSDDLNNNY